MMKQLPLRPFLRAVLAFVAGCAVMSGAPSTAADKPAPSAVKPAGALPAPMPEAENKATMKTAEFHGQPVALGPRDGTAAPVQNKALAGESHAAGALVIRTEDGRTAIRPARMDGEPIDPAGPVSKPSAWVLLLAGLAFALFVVKKRGGG